MTFILSFVCIFLTFLQETRIEVLAKFTLSEGQYSYLEWSPLNRTDLDSRESVLFCLFPI